MGNKQGANTVTATDDQTRQKQIKSKEEKRREKEEKQRQKQEKKDRKTFINKAKRNKNAKDAAGADNVSHVTFDSESGVFHSAENVSESPYLSARTASELDQISGAGITSSWSSSGAGSYSVVEPNPYYPHQRFQQPQQQQYAQGASVSRSTQKDTHTHQFQHPKILSSSRDFRDGFSLEACIPPEIARPDRVEVEHQNKACVIDGSFTEFNYDDGSRCLVPGSTQAIPSSGKLSRNKNSSGKSKKSNCSSNSSKHATPKASRSAKSTAPDEHNEGYSTPLLSTPVMPRAHRGENQGAIHKYTPFTDPDDSIDITTTSPSKTSGAYNIFNHPFFQLGGHKKSQPTSSKQEAATQRLKHADTCVSNSQQHPPPQKSISTFLDHPLGVDYKNLPKPTSPHPQRRALSPKMTNAPFRMISSDDSSSSPTTPTPQRRAANLLNFFRSGAGKKDRDKADNFAGKQSDSVGKDEWFESPGHDTEVEIKNSGKQRKPRWKTWERSSKSNKPSEKAKRLSIFGTSRKTTAVTPMRERRASRGVDVVRPLSATELTLRDCSSSSRSASSYNMPFTAESIAKALATTSQNVNASGTSSHSSISLSGNTAKSLLGIEAAAQHMIPHDGKKRPSGNRNKFSFTRSGRLSSRSSDSNIESRAMSPSASGGRLHSGAGTMNRASSSPPTAKSAAVCIMKLEELERAIEKTIREKFPDAEDPFTLSRKSSYTKEEEIKESKSLPTTPSLKKKRYVSRDTTGGESGGSSRQSKNGDVPITVDDAGFSLYSPESKSKLESKNIQPGNIKINQQNGQFQHSNQIQSNNHSVCYESVPSPTMSPVIMRKFGAEARHASISPKVPRARTAALYNSPSEMSRVEEASTTRLCQPQYFDSRAYAINTQQASVVETKIQTAACSSTSAGRKISEPTQRGHLSQILTTKVPVMGSKSLSRSKQSSKSNSDVNFVALTPLSPAHKSTSKYDNVMEDEDLQYHQFVIQQANTAVGSKTLKTYSRSQDAPASVSQCEVRNERLHGDVRPKDTRYTADTDKYGKKYQLNRQLSDGNSNHNKSYEIRKTKGDSSSSSSQRRKSDEVGSGENDSDEEGDEDRQYSGEYTSRDYEKPVIVPSFSAVFGSVSPKLKRRLYATQTTKSFGNHGEKLPVGSSDNQHNVNLSHIKLQTNQNHQHPFNMESPNNDKRQMSSKNIPENKHRCPPLKSISLDSTPRLTKVNQLEPLGEKLCSEKPSNVTLLSNIPGAGCSSKQISITPLVPAQNKVTTAEAVSALSVKERIRTLNKSASEGWAAPTSPTFTISPEQPPKSPKSPSHVISGPFPYPYFSSGKSENLTSLGKAPVKQSSLRDTTIQSISQTNQQQHQQQVINTNKTQQENPDILATHQSSNPLHLRPEIVVESATTLGLTSPRSTRKHSTDHVVFGSAVALPCRVYASSSISPTSPTQCPVSPTTQPGSPTPLSLYKQDENKARGDHKCSISPILIGTNTQSTPETTNTGKTRTDRNSRNAGVRKTVITSTDANDRTVDEETRVMNKNIRDRDKSKGVYRSTAETQTNPSHLKSRPLGAGATSTTFPAHVTTGSDTLEANTQRRHDQSTPEGEVGASAGVHTRPNILTTKLQQVADSAPILYYVSDNKLDKGYNISREGIYTTCDKDIDVNNVNITSRRDSEDLSYSDIAVTFKEDSRSIDPPITRDAVSQKEHDLPSCDLLRTANGSDAISKTSRSSNQRMKCDIKASSCDFKDGDKKTLFMRTSDKHSDSAQSSELLQGQNLQKHLANENKPQSEHCNSKQFVYSSTKEGLKEREYSHKSLKFPQQMCSSEKEQENIESPDAYKPKLKTSSEAQHTQIHRQPISKVISDMISVSHQTPQERIQQHKAEQSPQQPPTKGRQRRRREVPPQHHQQKMRAMDVTEQPQQKQTYSEQRHHHYHHQQRQQHQQQENIQQNQIQQQHQQQQQQHQQQQQQPPEQQHQQQQRQQHEQKQHYHQQQQGNIQQNQIHQQHKNNKQNAVSLHKPQTHNQNASLSCSTIRIRDDDLTHEPQVITKVKSPIFLDRSMESTEAEMAFVSGMPEFKQAPLPTYHCVPSPPVVCQSREMQTDVVTKADKGCDSFIPPTRNDPSLVLRRDTRSGAGRGVVGSSTDSVRHGVNTESSILVDTHRKKDISDDDDCDILDKIRAALVCKPPETNLSGNNLSTSFKSVHQTARLGNSLDNENKMEQTSRENVPPPSPTAMELLIEEMEEEGSDEDEFERREIEQAMRRETEMKTFTDKIYKRLSDLLCSPGEDDDDDDDDGEAKGDNVYENKKSLQRGAYKNKEKDEGYGELNAANSQISCQDNLENRHKQSNILEETQNYDNVFQNRTEHFHMINDDTTSQDCTNVDKRLVVLNDESTNLEPTTLPTAANYMSNSTARISLDESGMSQSYTSSGLNRVLTIESSSSLTTSTSESESEPEEPPVIVFKPAPLHESTETELRRIRDYREDPDLPSLLRNAIISRNLGADLWDDNEQTLSPATRDAERKNEVFSQINESSMSIFPSRSTGVELETQQHRANVEEPIVAHSVTSLSREPDILRPRQQTQRTYGKTAEYYQQYKQRRSSREYHSDDDVVSGRGVPDYYDDAKVWVASRQKQRPPVQFSQMSLAVVAQRRRERRERWLKKRRRNRTELLSSTGGSSDTDREPQTDNKTTHRNSTEMSSSTTSSRGRVLDRMSTHIEVSQEIAFSNQTPRRPDSLTMRQRRLLSGSSLEAYEDYPEDLETRDERNPHDMGSGILASPKYAKPIIPLVLGGSSDASGTSFNTSNTETATHDPVAAKIAAARCQYLHGGISPDCEDKNVPRSDLNNQFVTFRDLSGQLENQATTEPTSQVQSPTIIPGIEETFNELKSVQTILEGIQENRPVITKPPTSTRPSSKSIASTTKASSNQTLLSPLTKENVRHLRDYGDKTGTSRRSRISLADRTESDLDLYSERGQDDGSSSGSEYADDEGEDDNGGDDDETCYATADDDDGNTTGLFTRSRRPVSDATSDELLRAVDRKSEDLSDDNEMDFVVSCTFYNSNVYPSAGGASAGTGSGVSAPLVETNKINTITYVADRDTSRSRGCNTVVSSSFIPSASTLPPSHSNTSDTAQPEPQTHQPITSSSQKTSPRTQHHDDRQRTTTVPEQQDQQQHIDPPGYSGAGLIPPGCTFQSARYQMHDIQTHLQALRRQMEVLPDDEDDDINNIPHE